MLAITSYEPLKFSSLIPYSNTLFYSFALVDSDYYH